MDPLEYSRYARQLVAATPDLREELERARDSGWTRDAMQSFLRERGDGDEAFLHSGLRKLRQRVLLRTMARDLSGHAGLDEVCGTMSVLAVVAIEASLAYLEPRMPDGPYPGLVVVGMGKLGGGELNVSSDVDLVFLYPEGGESDGSGREGDLDLFTRLGRRLIAALGEPTEDGFVFRVDMRLRPWGDSGALVTSFDALEEYFVTQGREWERYAWIKARALGSEGENAALAAIVRPFVYRKYLDYGSFAAMRELHAQIREEVARRELTDQIKLGPGGIREIEFIAQVFQLIRGGRDPTLQIRPTLAVLALLAQRKLLPEAVVRELSEAYVFLRRLEHRLQYLDDAQTHELPEGTEDRSLVARAMGFDSWEAFRAGLDAHRTRVSSHFEEVFAVEEAPKRALAPLWTDSEETAQRLARLGFRDAAGTAARLAAVRSGARYRGLPQSSRARFDALIPRVIEESAAREDPDATLARSLELLETVSRRAAYLALLDEHPAALARLAQLLGASSWAAEYLNRHPIVLDELLDARSLFARPDWNAFAQDLRLQLATRQGDEERQMDWLREAHHAQVFRLLAQDLSGVLGVERLADDLSDLADVMLQVTLELCWMQLRNRHRDEPRFSIVGYGKLGGKELGYASDLDLIFLYEDPDDRAPEIYARLAQRLSHWLTSRTAAGVLFDIDLRLRPEGESGFLVSSIEAFRRYQRESAWTWEHQALTRARFCAGEATVGAGFETERRFVLQMPRDEQKLRADILSMRARMLESHPNASGLFDLKHDRGGMIDIEFIVQMLVLAHARERLELTANDGNIALLKLAARLALIPGDSADAVADAYREFRRRQHRLRLNGAKFARAPSEQVQTHIDATLALWRRVFGNDPAN
ncbi:MAG TPA: bifunctional [glutamate--ammonia ligase]-adenylyl-L-tyrosine phosphorylase/[glutamate--ammonia-ligase] adenylyltransferase [Burkholderiales bacterium]|nr:bifunctional [glutamate--ammonia ligase]-adenylyl-L-tyrosine phosphorylase/[glutamate--ammonia-ligase] adenylyltransferase [Burkholderiales bacterium]